MTRATRDRQIGFIKSFDRYPGSSLNDALSNLLARHGWAWLTDEQVEDLASEVVESARFSHRLRVRNRNALKRA